MVVVGLIYGAFVLLILIIQVVLNSTGILLGAIPTLLIYGTIIVIARVVTRKYETSHNVFIKCSRCGKRGHATKAIHKDERLEKTVYLCDKCLIEPPIKGVTILENGDVVGTTEEKQKIN